MEILFNLDTNYNSKWNYCNSYYRIQKHLGDKWALILHYYVPSTNTTGKLINPNCGGIIKQLYMGKKVKVAAQIGASNVIQFKDSHFKLGLF